MSGEPSSWSEFSRLALESYRDEFKDLAETWRHLDTKAQGLGAIAGIFLAAVFSWIQRLPPEFGRSDRLLILGSVLLLVSAVGAAVLALLVKSVTSPPLGHETEEMVADILQNKKDDELSERVTAFYNDQMKDWQNVNKDMREHIRQKAKRTSFGQVTLLLAAGCVAVLAIKFILSTL